MDEYSASAERRGSESFTLESFFKDTDAERGPEIPDEAVDSPSEDAATRDEPTVGGAPGDTAPVDADAGTAGPDAENTNPPDNTQPRPSPGNPTDNRTRPSQP